MSEKILDKVWESLDEIKAKLIILAENQTLILNELKATGEKDKVSRPKERVGGEVSSEGNNSDTNSKPVVKQEINLPYVKLEKKKKKESKIYELPGTLVAASDKAFCIKLEGKSDEWFPKSQITNSSYINDENFEDTQIFNFTEWILKQKGVL